MAGKVVLKGESGKYLIDKGRILEWTRDKGSATVYDIDDATIKQVNWPDTILIIEQAGRTIKKAVSELPELLIRVKALNLSRYALSKSAGINRSVWTGWFSGKSLPRPHSEIKIKQWLESLEK